VGQRCWSDFGRWVRTNDVIVGSPEIYVDGVEETEEGEPPGNTINNDAFASGEELVDNRS